MKDLKKEIVDSSEILNIVNEIKRLIKEDSYENEPIQDLKKVYPNETEKLEESLEE